MKKILIGLCMALAIITISGCAAMQTWQMVDQDEAAQLAVKIAAKRVGYAVIKNNPQSAQDIVAYAEILSNASDSEKLINEALPQAIAKLGSFANDPLVQSDIGELVSLARIKSPDVDIKIKSNLARAAISGFIEGCRLAQKSLIPPEAPKGNG